MIMTKGLFLDDERNPSDVKWSLLGSADSYPEGIDWKVVRNVPDFIDEMEKDIYDYYSFDHDLQDFWMQPKGTLIAQTAFGDVYSEEDEQGERTGYHAATYLKDYLTLYLKFHPMKGYFVHSKNPIGAEKIHNLLKGLT
jgi:hypothetical protein